MQRAALAIRDPLAAFAALLAAPPFASDLALFSRDRALAAAQTERIITELELVVLESGESRTAISTAQWQTFTSSLTAEVAAYHAENPDLQGIGRERLRLMLQPRLPKQVFAIALQSLSEKGEIVLDGAFVRLSTHEVRLGPEDQAAWDLIAPLLAGAERFRPPRVRDIAATTGRPEREVRRLLKLAGRMGWADEVALDHFFLRLTTDEMVRIAANVAAHTERGEFTAAQFRDRLENGRKVAIQILDFFDRHGVTLKRGDVRRVNSHRLDLFGASVLSSGGAPGGESSPVGRSDFKSE
jgi:selenocysteine-specific elongation factor